VEAASALEGPYRHDDVGRVGPAVGDRPEQRREEARVVAVDDQDRAVRPAAELAVERQRGGHAAEAAAEHEHAVARPPVVGLGLGEVGRIWRGRLAAAGPPDQRGRAGEREQLQPGHASGW
jgi:hypothetical protein